MSNVLLEMSAFCWNCQAKVGHQMAVSKALGRQVGPGMAFWGSLGCQVGFGMAVSRALGRQVGPGTAVWGALDAKLVLKWWFGNLETSFWEP